MFEFYFFGEGGGLKYGLSHSKLVYNLKISPEMPELRPLKNEISVKPKLSGLVAKFGCKPMIMTLPAFKLKM